MNAKDDAEWVGDTISQMKAEIEHYRNALMQFANPENWHETAGLQQWMGKLDARTFAEAVLKLHAHTSAQ